MNAASQTDSDRPVAVVTGYIVRFPLGGMSWVFLAYLLGLRELGFEPVFMETAGLSGQPHPTCCFDPDADRMTAAPDVGIDHLARTLATVGLDGLRWWYRDGDDDHGMSRAEARATLTDCDVLLDIAATCWCSEFDLAPRRVLVDCDAPFTQIRMLDDDGWADHVDRHHVLATYAVNLPDGAADMPDAGRRWVPTLPPVHVPSWPSDPPSPRAPWTTVTSWTSYGDRDWDGRSWRQKDATFDRIMDLPDRVDSRLQLALSGEAPRDRLRAHGWEVVDPIPRSRTVGDYADYLSGSKGELGVAKDAFVQARTGAFNNRAAAYLASGRPVVVADTGLSWLPLGDGVHAFRDVDDGADALRMVDDDLDAQASAARRTATQWFSASEVVADLLASADVAVPSTP